MHIIKFERKGINISLKIKEFTVDNRLLVDWKAEGANVIDGTNKHSSNGFFGNGEFDKYKNVIRIRNRNGFKIKGIKKAINGISLEDNVLSYFSETYKKMYTEKEELINNFVNEIVSGKIKLQWYDTTEYWDGYDIPVKKFKIDVDVPSNSYIWKIQRAALEKFGFDILESNTTEFIENSIKKEEKIGEMALAKVLEERIAKREMKQQNFDKLVKLAKETGENQLYRQYSTECNDGNESCDIDIVQEFVDVNGKIHYKRHHTW